MSAKEVTSKLNELLEKNYDTEKVYKAAANDVKNARLKAYFEEKAMQRYDFGHELKAEISSFGESPDKGSSINSDVHRAWMNLKAAFSSDKEESVLEEAIRAEEAAVGDYNKVIKADGFPPTTANLLIKQRNAIERSLTEIKELEKAFD